MQKAITKFLVLKDIAQKHGGTLAMSKPNAAATAFIEDIEFDAFADPNTLSTVRLYSMGKKLFNTDLDTSKLITQEFFAYCTKHVDENVDDIYASISVNESQCDTAAVSANNALLEELSKHPQFKLVSEQMFDIMHTVAKQIAESDNISIHLIDVDSITLHKPI